MLPNRVLHGWDQNDQDQTPPKRLEVVGVVPDLFDERKVVGLLSIVLRSVDLDHWYASEHHAVCIVF